MGQVCSWLYAERMAAEPVSAGRAREFVTRHLLGHDMQHLQDDICLTASELVTNAMTHAQTPITVLLQRAGPLVTLTVGDLSPVMPTTAAAREKDQGGLGLLIVEALSREWGVTSYPDGGKSVWASFPAEREIVPVL